MLKFRFINLLIIITGFVLLYSCTEQKKPESEIISVSILPQKFFVQALVGGEVAVNVMVPRGASPASYEPSPMQMKDLSNSRLYLSIGHLGYEKAWLPRYRQNYPELKIIDLSENINLIVDAHDEEEEEMEEGGHHHHGTDPHYWMSPKQVKTMVTDMARVLIDNKYQNEETILKNRDSLLIEIDKLDQLFTEELNKLQNRKFIIFHPALGYLARDYNLEQISMEFEGKEPSPAHLKMIVDRAKSENIHLMFIQREFDVENAKQLAKEIGSELLQIDPLTENWPAQMMDILSKLKTLDHN